MKKGLLIFIILIVAFSLSTCRKNDTTTPLVTSGGQAETVQGNVTLVVDITHHFWGVPHIPVYIMLDTNAWPGRDTAIYNLTGVTDHDGTVQFNHFGPGNFEIYSCGYDSIWGGYVLGYNNFSITKTDANHIVYDNVVVSEKF